MGESQRLKAEQATAKTQEQPSAKGESYGNAVCTRLAEVQQEGS